jgi:uncharacterized protein
MLGAAEAVTLAREANNVLAAAIARHPHRFGGFATVPTPAPNTAAEELEHAVTKLGLKGALTNGRPGGRFLDDPFFWPILETAERLAVPIYLHPAAPTSAVREASYEGISPAVGHCLSVGAWGWHMDTGLHAPRLIAADVFDRFTSCRS